MSILNFQGGLLPVVFQVESIIPKRNSLYFAHLLDFKARITSDDPDRLEIFPTNSHKVVKNYS